MDAVQPWISLIYTTNKEKNLAPKVCSKKNFQIVISGFVANVGRFAHMRSDQIPNEHFLLISARRGFAT